MVIFFFPRAVKKDYIIRLLLQTDVADVTCVMMCTASRGHYHQTVIGRKKGKGVKKNNYVTVYLHNQQLWLSDRLSIYHESYCVSYLNSVTFLIEDLETFSFFDFTSE